MKKKTTTKHIHTVVQGIEVGAAGGPLTASTELLGPLRQQVRPKLSLQVGHVLVCSVGWSAILQVTVKKSAIQVTTNGFQDLLPCEAVQRLSIPRSQGWQYPVLEEVVIPARNIHQGFSNVKFQ